MKTKLEPKRCKTFPLEMEDTLHKALKYKAIESDQTLHAFIIGTLSARVEDDSAQYAVHTQQAVQTNGKKKK